MNTPVLDFLNEYASADISRLHMPGAKGKMILGPEGFDITEVNGADDLYYPDGIIRQSEENAASLFGTGITCYSTEGSSHCIRSALMLIKRICGREDDHPLILAARNVHKSFVYGIALAGMEAEWIDINEPDRISLSQGQPSPSEIEAALDRCSKKPAAVYLTSPNYSGEYADIKEIKKICKDRGVLLMVDNAHGAYLRFLEKSMHPMDLGADICCDSAHKTLPVLTGGAYLHLKEGIADLGAVKSAMEVTGSTSPSYLILASLDKANGLLSSGLAREIRTFEKRMYELKRELSALGITLIGDEPFKVTVNALKLGIKGTELAEILRKHGAEPESCDRACMTVMLTPFNDEKDLLRLKGALVFAKNMRLPELKGGISLPAYVKKMTVREAVLAPQEVIDAALSKGRICASPLVACPAVPVVMSGEEIEDGHIELFEKLGIKKVSVVIS